MPKHPLFEVYAVEDGPRFGLFIVKSHEDGRSEKVYVFLNDTVGLRPTAEIEEAVRWRFVELDPTRYHRILLAELRAYANHAHATGEMHTIRSLVGHYSDKEKFGDILGRIFERGNEDLATFLVSREVFYDRILKKCRGEDKVEGKAETFGVLSPHDISVTQRLHYLRRAEDVLGSFNVRDATSRAQWFRRQGPTAVDFEAKAFHRRQAELDRLRSLVLGNPVSILEGSAASGKTVLVLNLAYDLLKSHEKRVYYFDCDKDRDFDRASLTSDLRNVTGVVILENVHLAPGKLQWVYSDFKYDKDRNILLSARPTYRDYQQSKSESLCEMSSISLEPYEDSDALIDEFLVWQKAVAVPPDVRQQMKEISAESLWLLAYALTGYAQNHGDGGPKTWIRVGVLQDLQDLENANTDYPEVLVAVSAVYRNESLMAEPFLTSNLGFPVGVLNSLCQRGEVIRHVDQNGEVFYGLPHTALADAYWEFGNKYRRRRKLADYESVIYDYISLGPSNGLRVLAEAEGTVRERVMARLEKEAKLPEIISHEQSAGAVHSWLRAAHTSTVARKDVLTALAQNIEEHGHAVYVPDLLNNLFWRGEDTWQAFRSHLNCGKLVRRMVSTGGTVWIGITIFQMFRYDEVMMRELYGLVDLDKLLRELNETEDTWTIGRCISAIYKVDPNAHKKLEVGLDWRGLADKLCGSSLLWSTEQCLREIMYANRSAARKLCRLLSVPKLVEALNNHFGHMTSRGQVIATIYQANHAFGETLWRAYVDKLGQEMNRMEDPGKAIDDLRAIGLASPKMACELLDFLDRKRLVQTLSGGEDLVQKVEFARWVLNLKKATGRGFWEQYKHSLAAGLAEPPAISSIAPCLREIAFGDKERPYELCGLLNIGKIADNLNNSVDFWSAVDDILSTVLQAHKGRGQALWKNVHCEQAPHPNGRLFSDVWSGLSHVKDIRSIDEDIAAQLCAQLDIELLADHLSQAGELFVKEVGEWVNTVHALIPSRGRQLGRALDKKRLAATLSLAEDVKNVVSCLEHMEAAQEQKGWVEELCTHLDTAPLAFNLKHTEDEECRERLLAVISRNCPVIHQQLLQLLGQE